jgi:hypothetical protein
LAIGQELEQVSAPPVKPATKAHGRDREAPALGSSAQRGRGHAEQARSSAGIKESVGVSVLTERG